MSFFFVAAKLKKFECKCVSPAGEKISWKVFSHFFQQQKNGIERKRKEAAACIEGIEPFSVLLCLSADKQEKEKKKKNFHLFSFVTFTRCFIARYLRGMIVKHRIACPFGIAIRRTDTYRERFLSFQELCWLSVGGESLYEFAWLRRCVMSLCFFYK